MFEGLFITLGATLLILWIVFRNCVVIIPARSFALAERLGAFNRVLLPGLHWVPWPIETLRTLMWTYVGQNRQLRTLTFTCAPFDSRQMDVPPVACFSKDKCHVDIDVSVTYKVTDLAKAGYETIDPLNLLYQYLTQAIRNAASERNAAEFNGQEELIASATRDYVNRMMTKPTDRGLICDSVVIQNIAIDNALLKVNQDMLTRKAQHEMALRQKQAEFELQKMDAEVKRAAEENNQGILNYKMQQEETRKTRVAEEEAKRRAAAGLTPEHTMRMEELKVQMEATRSAEKVVYAPLEYWAAPRFSK